MMGSHSRYVTPCFRNVRLQWVVGRRQAKQRLWRSKTRLACSGQGYTFAKLYILCCWLHTLWVAGDLDDEQVRPAAVLPVIRHNISIAFEACLCDKVWSTSGAAINLTGTPAGCPGGIPGGTALSLPSVLPFPEACACSQGSKPTLKSLREVKVSHCLMGGGRSRQIPIGGGKDAVRVYLTFSWQGERVMISLGRCSSADENKTLIDLAIVVLTAAHVVPPAILHPKLNRTVETYLDGDSQALKWHPLLPTVIECCFNKYRNDRGALEKLSQLAASVSDSSKQQEPTVQPKPGTHQAQEHMAGAANANATFPHLAFMSRTRLRLRLHHGPSKGAPVRSQPRLHGQKYWNLVHQK